MPDSRAHRGAHPRDQASFAPAQIPVLRTATAQLSWLLTRGYPGDASAVLVGNRYALRSRQRDALQRCAASDQACAARESRRLEPAAMAGRALSVDGYNALLTVEAALGGGVVLEARDRAFRDLSSMSRHYRRVAETRRALELIGETLAELACGEVLWLFDQPISNSGKLAKLVREIAAERSWPWTAELVPNPDRVLRSSRTAVATADSGILDRCGDWLNLARLAVEAKAPAAWRVDLAGGLP
jgi:hypothetical protein